MLYARLSIQRREGGLSVKNFIFLSFDRSFAVRRQIGAYSSLRPPASLYHAGTLDRSLCSDRTYIDRGNVSFCNTYALLPLSRFDEIIRDYMAAETLGVRRYHAYRKRVIPKI